MEIVLLRHGIAENRAKFKLTGRDDHLRPLTEKGRIRARKVCQNLKFLYPHFDLIVSSSLVRAVQTREIAEKVFSHSLVLQAAELSPSSSPESFVKWIKSVGKKCDRILVIGHEPQLGLLVSHLIANKSESFLDIRKSGLVCLEIENAEEIKPGTAVLTWAVPPRLLLKKRPK